MNGFKKQKTRLENLKMGKQKTVKLKQEQTTIQKRVRRMWDTIKYIVMCNFAEEKQEGQKQQFSN